MVVAASAVALAFGAAAAGLGAAGMFGGIPAASPPRPGQGAQAAATTAASGPATPAPATAAPRERVDAGVAVVLRDAGGAPLAGSRVALRSTDPDRSRDEPPRRVGRDARSLRQLLDGSSVPDVRPGHPTKLTDGDGRCEWRHPGAGGFRVEVVDRPAVGASFELAADRGRLVELRLPDDLVVVTGRFVRGDQVERDLTARVDLAAGGVERASPEGRDGDILLLLSAGTHRLRAVAYHPGARADRRGESLTWSGPAAPPDADGWLCFADELLTVPAGVARFEWSVQVEGCDVALAVQTASGQPVGAVDVEVDGTALRDGQSVAHTLRSGGDSRALLRRLPPGVYRVGVRGDHVLADDGHELRVLVGDRRLELPVVVAPAATVRVQVRDRQGRSITVPRELLPPLRAAGREFACASDGGGVLGGRVLRYVGVPPGPATLACADRLVDGAWHYLPFDPMPERTIDARPLADAVFDLDVEPRALVDLRGCERGGREQFDAEVAVFAGDRPVASLATGHASRWQAYLPPGDYRVTVDRQGVVREHAIVVARADLRLRLRP